MDILITCITYLALSLSLTYYIFAATSKKKRKKNNVLDACFENIAFIPWVIGFAFDTLFTLGYYIGFFKNFDARIYLLTVVLLTCFSLIGLYFARWKIILQNDELIKYGIIRTTRIKITDITKIRDTVFGKKFYVNDKKLFEISARYHDYSNSFVNTIKEISNCEIVALKEK